MNKFIPLSVPNVKGNEKKYVMQALEEEWVSTAGAYIIEFEKKISEYLKIKGTAACQSGTAGLHLALQVCGVEPGDEVIVPALTFIAAVNPVKYVGAEPIFMDCDDTLTMDIDKLEEFCNKECKFDGKSLINKSTGKKIKAVVIVHVFGNMADMPNLMRLAKTYNLKIIEDATEALGTRYLDSDNILEEYRGKYAGTIGDMGVYSFNGNKIITTGGGGMVVSNNEQYIERVKYLSTQAKDDTLYFIHDEIGYNYRMTNIQAAIGLGQLERLEEFIQYKNDNYDRYVKNDVSLIPFRSEIRANKWFYSYEASDRDGLIAKLAEDKIQVRPIWKLIHTLKPYIGCQSYKIEKAYKYYGKIINIPCSTGLTEEDINSVSERIHCYER